MSKKESGTLHSHRTKHAFIKFGMCTSRIRGLLDKLSDTMSSLSGTINEIHMELSDCHKYGIDMLIGLDEEVGDKKKTKCIELLKGYVSRVGITEQHLEKYINDMDFELLSNNAVEILKSQIFRCYECGAELGDYSTRQLCGKSKCDSIGCKEDDLLNEIAKLMFNAYCELVRTLACGPLVQS